MKSKKLLVAAIYMLTATAAFAQQHIQKTFDALRQSKYLSEQSTSRSIEKNPDTGHTTGMSDVFKFEMDNPSKQGRQLIADIQHAFEQDEPAAYSISTGSDSNAEDYTSLAVGDSKNGGVAIGLIKGSRWIYACFLDPEDTLRQHRYAYALEWVEEDGKIHGLIAKTYATTQKFRRLQNNIQRSIIINGKPLSLDPFGDTFGTSFSFGDGNVNKSSETWLSEFNTYKNLFLKNPDGTAANLYATRIYKLCKDAQSLDDAEKNIAAAEIDKLKGKTKDEFIQQLFDMSIERLKK
ncbi:MAG: hypothetical protein IJM81_08165 [Prevotella sp.]|nr:hypothetical protein [Prevotella sp.]